MTRPQPRRIKSSSDNAVEKLISIIKSTAETLALETDLSPKNPTINYVLTKFVHGMTAEVAPGVVSAVLDADIVKTCRASLLRGLNQAECEMERYFAAKILESETISRATLDLFPYIGNYEELTDFELAHWASVRTRPDSSSHVVFVGSGPLPLTAILMHLKTQACVSCVDVDREAVRQSCEIIQRMGLASRMQVIHSRGEDMCYSGVTHVVVAAMVATQVGVLERVLQDAPRAQIGVRSVRGLRTMLYDPVDHGAIIMLPLVYTGGSATNETVINTLETFEPRPTAAMDTALEHRCVSSRSQISSFCMEKTPVARACQIQAAV